MTNVFDGSLALVWADGTNGTGTNPSAHDVIARITRGFSDGQLGAVRQVDSPADIPSACPQNFNLFSECFAAVAFNSLPGSDGTSPLNYTIRADGGLFHIDVTKHSSDYEQRLLPLQWAIDSVSPVVLSRGSSYELGVGNYRTPEWIDAPNSDRVAIHTRDERGAVHRHSFE